MGADCRKNYGAERIFALGLVFFAVPTVSTAADYGYSLGYSATHSNNMALADTNRSPDWLNSAQARFAFQENELPTVTGRLYSQLERDEYANHTFDNQTLFLLNSAATWMIRPQFSWTGEDYYGQIPINPQATNTPNNIQNVNVFTTGPNWLLRMDPLNSLELGARYDNFHSDTGNNNSNRVSAFAGWLYQYSPITVFSLNYNAQHSAYAQNAGNSGYDRQDLFLRMNARRPYAALIMDLGNTWLKQSGPGSVTGVYARLLASRQLTETSTASLSAGSTITDTAEQILASEGVGTVAAGSIASTDTYRLTDVDANYLNSEGYVTDSIDLFYDRLKYYTAPLDQYATGTYVNLGYEFSRAFSGSVFGSYRRTLFYTGSIVNRDNTEGSQLTYRVRPNLFLGLLGQETRRRSTAVGSSYSETRVVMSITYYSNYSLITAGNVAPPLVQRDSVERELLFSR